MSRMRGENCRPARWKIAKVLDVEERWPGALRCGRGRFVEKPIW
jgi:hypothetical protein